MSKKNFTLIELLIVVAIIGILVSLLLPSLSKAREKTRRAVCISNQRQIGIALTSYEDTFKVLPPANAIRATNFGNTLGVGSIYWRAGNVPFGIAYLKITKLIDTAAVFYCPSWTLEDLKYGKLNAAGNQGGWPVNETIGPWPTSNVMSSYHYRDTLSGPSPYKLAKSADYNSAKTALLSDHWTKSTNGLWGQFGHKGVYATLYLDGHGKLMYDQNDSYMKARQTAATTNSNWSLQEIIWREFFDK